MRQGSVNLIIVSPVGRRGFAARTRRGRSSNGRGSNTAGGGAEVEFPHHADPNGNAGDEVGLSIF